MDCHPENKRPALRVMAMPADANQNGDIFGGWIMSHVDIAGGVLAGRTARGRVATVAVKEFIFKRSEEHTSELQSQSNLVCRLLLEKKKKNKTTYKRTQKESVKQRVCNI